MNETDQKQYEAFVIQVKKLLIRSADGPMKGSNLCLSDLFDEHGMLATQAALEKAKSTPDIAPADFIIALGEYQGLDMFRILSAQKNSRNSPAEIVNTVLLLYRHTIERLFNVHERMHGRPAPFSAAKFEADMKREGV